MDKQFVALESLERLVMPDKMYKEKIKELGLKTGYDYNLIREVIIDSLKSERVLNGLEDYLNMRFTTAVSPDEKKVLQEIYTHIKTLRDIVESTIKC